MERVRFASIHNLATGYKISLIGIENPRSTGTGYKSVPARMESGKSRKTFQIPIENGSHSQFSINHKTVDKYTTIVCRCLG